MRVTNAKFLGVLFHIYYNNIHIFLQNIFQPCFTNSFYNLEKK